MSKGDNCPGLHMSGDFKCFKPMLFLAAQQALHLQKGGHSELVKIDICQQLLLGCS